MNELQINKLFCLIYNSLLGTIYLIKTTTKIICTLPYRHTLSMHSFGRFLVFFLFLFFSFL